MICPDCKGAKDVFAFVNTGPDASKHRSGMMPCRRCSGRGAVPFQMAEWMRQGRLMRDARVARRESLREAAQRLGMGSAVLSRLEQGYEPIPESLLRAMQ